MRRTEAIELEGFGPGGLADFIGGKVLMVSWPSAQTACMAWDLMLHWDSGMAWKFGGRLSVGADGLTELGHLAVLCLNGVGQECVVDRVYRRVDLLVAKIGIATVDEGGVHSECAVSMSGGNLDELFVANAPSPSSVAFWTARDVGPALEYDASMLAWRYL